MIAVSNVLPLPNPPLIKGRELDFLVSPQSIGGIKGGNNVMKIQDTTFKTSSNN
jgi:hypothetical protein